MFRTSVPSFHPNSQAYWCSIICQYLQVWMKRRNWGPKNLSIEVINCSYGRQYTRWMVNLNFKTWISLNLSRFFFSVTWLLSPISRLMFYHLSMLLRTLIEEPRRFYSYGEYFFSIFLMLWLNLKLCSRFVSIRFLSGK